MSRHMKERIEKVGLFILLSLIALVVFLPFCWLILTSIKPESQVVIYPPRLWPQTMTLEAYTSIWHRIPFARFFLNTIVFAVSVTAISLTLDSFAAYAFARLEFWGRDVLFTLVLITLMLPFQVSMVPLFGLLNSFGWLDSYAGLIIPRASNAFGIFFLRQFFRGIPTELEDAAFVDGASTWRIYWQIILPLSKSAIATLTIFHFMYNWNDFLWPLIMTTTTEMRTLPTGLALFMGQHVVEYAVLMAGVVLSLLPITLAFLAAQNHFVQGIALTGIKG